MTTLTTEYNKLITEYVAALKKALLNKEMLVVQTPFIVPPPVITGEEAMLTSDEPTVQYGPFLFDQWLVRFLQDPVEKHLVANFETALINLNGLCAMDKDGNIEYFIETALHNLYGAGNAKEFLDQNPEPAIGWKYRPVISAPDVIKDANGLEILNLLDFDKEGVLVAYNANRQEISIPAFADNLVKVVGHLTMTREEADRFVVYAKENLPSDLVTGLERINDILDIIYEFREMDLRFGEPSPQGIKRSVIPIHFIYDQLLYKSNYYIQETASGILGMIVSMICALPENGEFDVALAHVVQQVKIASAEVNTPENWERLDNEFNAFLTEHDIFDVLDRRALPIDEVKSKVWSMAGDAIEAQEVSGETKVSISDFIKSLDTIGTIYLTNAVTYEVCFVTAPTGEYREEFDRLLNFRHEVFPGAMVLKSPMPMRLNDLREISGIAPKTDPVHLVTTGESIPEEARLRISELFAYLPTTELDYHHLVGQIDGFAAGFTAALIEHDKSFGSCVNRVSLQEGVEHHGRIVEKLSRNKDLENYTDAGFAGGVNIAPGAKLIVVYKDGETKNIALIDDSAEVVTDVAEAAPEA